MDDSILIVGSGALACFFAANLSAVGIKVKLLTGWKDAISAIRLYGVRVIGPNQIERAYPVEIFDSVDDVGKVCFALVLVKSWQTENSAKQLTSCLGSEGIALTLQNGLGNREILQSNLGSDRVASGIALLGASIIAPGLITASSNNEVHLEKCDKLNSIVLALRHSGFYVNISEDIHSLLWGKLVANAAINPLSMLLGVKNGDLLSIPQGRFLLHKLAREVFDLALLLGHKPPFENPIAYVEEVIKRTAENYSSMLQDSLRNAPTEIDAMNGKIVHYANLVDADVPYNQAVYNIVKATLHSKGQKAVSVFGI